MTPEELEVKYQKDIDRKMHEVYIKQVENLISECRNEIDRSTKQIKVSEKNIALNYDQIELYEKTLNIAKMRLKRM